MPTAVTDAAPAARRDFRPEPRQFRPELGPERDDAGAWCRAAGSGAVDAYSHPASAVHPRLRPAVCLRRRRQRFRACLMRLMTSGSFARAQRDYEKDRRVPSDLAAELTKVPQKVARSGLRRARPTISRCSCRRCVATSNSNGATWTASRAMTSPMTCCSMTSTVAPPPLMSRGSSPSCGMSWCR